MVESNGGDSSGEYIHTLNGTDIYNATHESGTLG